MSNNHDQPSQSDQLAPVERPPEEPILATVVEESSPPVVAPPRPKSGLRWQLPLALFLATCAATVSAGTLSYGVIGGWIYAAAIMTILVCHEAGHYVQTRRYGVPSSLPFFIPMPISPIGTMGAVIVMDSRIKDRKALFDIGISGPLAGLVPTLICCIWGIHQEARLDILRPGPGTFELGEPLVFKLISYLKFGPLSDGQDVMIGPVGFAGWVGLLVTSLNLFPIGQLDGGHILYALTRRRAHGIAKMVLFGAIAAALIASLLYWNPAIAVNWSLMLGLLLWMGPRHPPTGDDEMPLGWGRIVLGWLTLAFLVIGFTPIPMMPAG